MYIKRMLSALRSDQFSFEDVLLDDFQGEGAARLERRERAALILLAAAGTVTERDVRAEFGRESVEAKRDQYAALYTQRLGEKAQSLATAMTSYYTKPSKKARPRLPVTATAGGGRNKCLTLRAQRARRRGHDCEATMLI